MTRALGIDFGHHTVKIAEIEIGSKGRQIIGLYELTPREGQDHADALRTFFGQSQVRAEKIGIALNDSNTLVKRFEFPFRDKKRVKMAVEGEWMDIVPFELEEYAIDTRISERHGRAQGFISGLCPNARIEVLNLLCDSAWIQPNAVFVDSEVLALLALSQNLPETETAESYAVCDFGYELTKLAVIRGSGMPGQRRAPNTPGFDPEILELRHIDKGSKEWINWIADKRRVTTDEALQWLVHRAEIQPKAEGEESIREDLSDDIKSALRPVIVELHQTLQSCRVRTGLNPEILYITGSMCRIQGLREFLEHELRIKVEVWPLFHSFDAHDAVVSPTNQKSFATAIAIASAFSQKAPHAWLNFRRTTSPNKKLLTETFQRLTGPELKPAFALLGCTLVFMWLYGMLGSYLATFQQQAVERDLVAEFRRLDNGMGTRAASFVSDPDRAREIYEGLRKKKAPKTNPASDMGPRPQVAILEDFSVGAPSQVKIIELEVQYGTKDTLLKAVVAPAKGSSGTQLPSDVDQYMAGLKRWGYSDFQKTPQGSGETIRLNAKLLPSDTSKGAVR
ncbi:MAG: pilus assembly protein PilM [Bdellovibrionota bacterium]